MTAEQALADCTLVAATVRGTRQGRLIDKFGI
jgi:hypothetical protein